MQKLYLKLSLKNILQRLILKVLLLLKLKLLKNEITRLVYHLKVIATIYPLQSQQHLKLNKEFLLFILLFF